MPQITAETDPRHAAEEASPREALRTRISRRRSDRIREFICSHLPDHVDVEVIITSHIATAAVLPADIDAILGTDATEINRKQAGRLLKGVDADYLVLVTGNAVPLERIPLNDQLTADHAHQFGLAFHELLHILKTAIVAIGQLLEAEIDEQYHEQVHDLINIVEDGAIESEAIHGENFSDNVSIRLELTRRIHSQTPEDIPKGQQIHYSFWDAVTSTLYDTAIYPTGVTEVLLDPNDDRIVFKSDADQQAFEGVHGALEQLAEEALAIRSADPGDTTHSHDKHASVLRAKRVIETWKTAIQPVIENQPTQNQKQTSEERQDDDTSSGQQDRDGGGRNELAEPATTAPEPGPDSLPDNFDPSDVSLDREATDDPYQDVFEHPAVTPDPDPEDVDDIEDLQSEPTDADSTENGADGDASTVDVESSFEEEEEEEVGSGSTTDGDGRDDDTADGDPQSRAQALAEAIDRTRERERQHEGDAFGQESKLDHRSTDALTDQAKQGSQPSGEPDRDQLALDGYETSSSDADGSEVEFDSKESDRGSELSEQDVSETESGLDMPVRVYSSSEEDNQGSEPKPSGPAHARSSERSSVEDLEAYEDALDADRRAAHDEADREDIDRDALERELEDLARSLDRYQRRNEGGDETDSDGGNRGGPGSLDGIDLLPITDDLVPPREWAAVEEGAHQVAGTLEKELRLERRRGERTGLTTGSYDTRAGHRLAIGDPRVCKTRTPGREKRYCLVFVLDRSGSMRQGSPPKIEVATKALARFAVASETLGIKVAIIDFIHGKARLVKPFSIEARHVQWTLLDTSCGGGTPLADAIGLARKLIESQRDEPLIITVTDDEPQSVDAVIEEIRASHAPVCSLTIATDCPQGTLSPDASELARYYERQAAVYTPEGLDDRLDQFASLLAGI